MKLIVGMIALFVLLPVVSARYCGDGVCIGAETLTLSVSGEGRTLTFGDYVYTVKLVGTSDVNTAVISVDGTTASVTKGQPTEVNGLMVTLIEATYTDAHDTDTAAFILGEDTSSCSTDCVTSSGSGSGDGSTGSSSGGSGSGSTGSGSSTGLLCGNGVCEKETVSLHVSDGERTATLAGTAHKVQLLGTSDERTAIISIDGVKGTVTKGDNVMINSVNVYLAGASYYPDLPEKTYAEIILGENVHYCSQDCGPVCGNGKCEDGEKTTCADDCAVVCTAVYQPLCGKDGVTYSNECFLHAAGAAIACKGECPCTNTVPDGCHEVKDDTGAIHLECPPSTCPVVSSDAIDRCTKEGGKADVRELNGCKTFNCVFDDSQLSFLNAQECPDPAGIEKKLSICKEEGLDGVIIVQHGCKIGTCIAPGQYCKEDTSETRTEVQQKCATQGLEAGMQFGEDGCLHATCVQPGECLRVVPKEATDRCSAQGGKMVIKRASDDEQACISFVQCVRAGRPEDIQYEKVDAVPAPEKLLSFVFKMEELKQILTRMVDKTTSLKEFYVGKPEEKTFEKVSSLFQQALDKIDSIKSDLRTKVESDTITTADVEQMKVDIKTIRSLLKSALLELLGSTEDKQAQVAEVQSDPKASFEEAFTTCTPISTTFDNDKTTVQLLGLDDGKCKMHVQTAAGLEMTCLVSDYALGLKTEHVASWGCTGSLADAMKKNAVTSSSTAAVAVAQTPSTCGDDCVRYCTEHLVECKRYCAEHLDTCSPAIREALAQLETTASAQPTTTGILPGEPLPPTARPIDCTRCVDDGVCGETECSTCADCVTGGSV